MPQDPHELNLNRLRAKRRERPSTKAGQVRQAWPVIRELLEAGHSLKDVLRWVNEAGIEIGYARLSHYVCQLRREKAIPSDEIVRIRRAEGSDKSTEEAEQARPFADPLSNLRAREARPTGFQYNPDADLKKLI